MQKVRVKVYGLFSLTKRTYLVVQCFYLGLVVLAFSLGLCLPRPQPAPDEPLPPLAVAVVRLLDALPWLALLFLLAGEDRVVDAHLTRAFADGLKGAAPPQVHWYPEMYHEVLNDPQRDRVMEDIVAFLSQHGLA